MSDIRCVVCGEPWDAWGTNHGDMKKWEYELFRKGAGCPACEGETPEHGLFQPETLEDVEFGDGDPVERIFQYEDVENRPEWKPPDIKVIWTCAACGVQAVYDESELYLDGREIVGDALRYELPNGAKAKQWYNRPDYENGEPGEEPAHIFGEGKDAQPVCELCLQHCKCCGEPVCSNLDTNDCYDPGYCSTVEGYGYGTDDVYCVECLSVCEKCGGRQCEHENDCTCWQCPKCYEMNLKDDCECSQCGYEKCWICPECEERNDGQNDKCSDCGFDRNEEEDE